MLHLNINNRKLHYSSLKATRYISLHPSSIVGKTSSHISVSSAQEMTDLPSNITTVVQSQLKHYTVFQLARHLHSRRRLVSSSCTWSNVLISLNSSSPSKSQKPQKDVINELHARVWTVISANGVSFNEVYWTQLAISYIHRQPISYKTSFNEDNHPWYCHIWHSKVHLQLVYRLLRRLPYIWVRPMNNKLHL